MITLTLLFSMHSHADIDEQNEQVKALFIYNFSNYVEWPNSAFKNDNSFLKICLFGEIPFYPFLNIFNGTIVKSRQLDITNTQNLDSIKSGCHILFVGNDKKENLPDLFKNIQNSYVLSIGNSEDFSNNGGVISIMRTQDQIEFEININQALKNKLYITSDLLSLARAIHQH
jgi:hypothetical protein